MKSCTQLIRTWKKKLKIKFLNKLFCKRIERIKSRIYKNRCSITSRLLIGRKTKPSNICPTPTPIYIII